MTGREMYEVLEMMHVVKYSYSEFMTELNEKLELFSSLIAWEYENERPESAEAYAKVLRKLRKLYNAM